MALAWLVSASSFVASLSACLSVYLWTMQVLGRRFLRDAQTGSCVWKQPRRESGWSAGYEEETWDARGDGAECQRWVKVSRWEIHLGCRSIGWAIRLKSVQMWRTGGSYELVGVPGRKKTGISDYLKSHRLRRQPVFMIESITIHGRLLWNQQFFL